METYVYFIIGGIVIVLILAIILIISITKKKLNEDSGYNEFANMKVEKLNVNKNDINKMNSLNDNFVVNKQQNQKINIPNFKRDKPIGYQNMNYVQGSYGDRVAETHNKN